MRNRGIKVKLNAKQKRQTGWAVAKDAAKDLLVGSTMRDLKAGANAASAKLKDKSIKHLGEAGGAGLVGLATQAIKEIPTNIKNVGRVAYGTLRGIFNHPDWYKYKGNLSTPAHNILRPFTPDTLRPTLTASWDGGRPGQYIGPGAGVTHYINVALKFNDMRNEESFKLATLEAFRAIRLDLKSNLPYTQAAYDNYIAMASSVYIKAKAVEKLLGLYNYTRGDIPEFSRAQKTVAFNAQETGILTPTEIEMVKEGNYADTVAQFERLSTIISNIAIPRKLAEYLAWWVGSNFVDQAAPNPQIYSTILREAFCYAAEADYSLSVAKDWDIATGSVQDIIDEALDLLTKFGIMNADIVKTGRYGFCSVVIPDNYSPVFLNDPEFFSILINAYSKKAGDPLINEVFKKEYIRVDALEELNDVNLVGMTNALSTWAGKVVPCQIISQSCYLQVDDTFDLPAAISGQYTTGSQFAITTENDGCWVQVSTDIYNDEVINTTNTAATVSLAASINNRLDSAVIGAASAATISISGFNRTVGTAATRLVLCGQGDNCIVINKATQSVQLQKFSDSTLIAALTFSGTVTWSGSDLTVTTGTITVPAAQVATVAQICSESAYWFTPAGTYVTITISYPISNTPSVNVVVADNDVAPWFNELVDYHLPLMVRKRTTYKLNGTTISEINHVPKLYKECYKPMIFNLADIDTVLYWMYLALFSME